MKRKRAYISPKILAAENAAITQFLFDEGIPSRGMRLPLQHVFDRYEKWRSLNKMSVSQLSIDGFGRLFPRAYPRKSAYWRPVKHALKCIFNLGLK